MIKPMQLGQEDACSDRESVFYEEEKRGAPANTGTENENNNSSVELASSRPISCHNEVGKSFSNLELERKGALGQEGAWAFGPRPKVCFRGVRSNTRRQHF